MIMEFTSTKLRPLFRGRHPSAQQNIDNIRNSRTAQPLQPMVLCVVLCKSSALLSSSDQLPQILGNSMIIK